MLGFMCGHRLKSLFSSLMSLLFDQKWKGTLILRRFWRSLSLCFNTSLNPSEFPGAVLKIWIIEVTVHRIGLLRRQREEFFPGLGMSHY